MTTGIGQLGRAITNARVAAETPPPTPTTPDGEAPKAGRKGERQGSNTAPTKDASRGADTTPDRPVDRARDAAGSVLDAIGDAAGSVIDVVTRPVEAVVDWVREARREAAADRATLEGATEVLESTPTGAALLEATVGQGVEIVISTDAEYAHYDDDRGDHGAIVIHPDAINGDPVALAGLLAHELGHAYVDHHGIEDTLDDLPDKLGTVGDEIVAETVASAILYEAGIVRTESSISHGDGTYRTPREGLDQILTTGYVDYYGIDLDDITDAERAAAAEVLEEQSIAIITALGGTPPPWIHGS